MGYIVEYYPEKKERQESLGCEDHGQEYCGPEAQTQSELKTFKSLHPNNSIAESKHPGFLPPAPI